MDYNWNLNDPRGQQEFKKWVSRQVKNEINSYVNQVLGLKTNESVHNTLMTLNDTTINTNSDLATTNNNVSTLQGQVSTLIAANNRIFFDAVAGTRSWTVPTGVTYVMVELKGGGGGGSNSGSASTITLPSGLLTAAGGGVVPPVSGIVGPGSAIGGSNGVGGTGVSVAVYPNVTYSTTTGYGNSQPFGLGLRGGDGGLMRGGSTVTPGASISYTVGSGGASGGGVGYVQIMWVA